MLIKTFYLSALILAAPVLVSQAQNTRIQTIRKEFSQVKAQIARTENPVFYKDQLTTNHQSKHPNWPAVGIYTETLTAYYTLGNQKGQTYQKYFRKIDIKGTRSASKEKTEILYDAQGRLMFIFTQSMYYEYRFYFNPQGKIIRLVNQQKITENPSKLPIEAQSIVNDIRNKAQHLVKTLQKFH